MENNDVEVKLIEEPFDENSLIVTDDAVYTPRKFETNDVDFDTKYAYVKDLDNPDAIFYPYRGKLKKYSNLPGMYKGNLDVPYFIEPSDEDRPNYILSTHLSDLNTDNIVKVLVNNKNIYYAYPESSKLFIPDVDAKDDILKRALKLAFKAKSINLDDCKDRFEDKNQLFNFKSVIKGPLRLSMLVFERGCEALGLKYRIILEEANPNEVIGTSLNDPEAKNNIIRNIKGNSVMDESDNTKIPEKVKDNFRTDSLDLNGKIVVSSDDTYDY